MTTITDGYTRANSTSTLGSTESPVLAYTADNGTWGILNNQAYVVTQAGFDSRATIPVGVKNMDVSAAITTAQDAGVMASYVDAGNYYLAKIISNSVTVVRRQGGVDTNMTTGAGTWADGATLRLVTNDSGSGTQVTAYIGAAQVYTNLDTTAGRPAGTRAGLRDGTGGSPGSPRFDNLSVVYTEPPTPPTPPSLQRSSVVDLCVRISGGPGVERRVTNEVKDLTFSTTAPGGFQAATVSLNRPLIFRPGEFQQFGRLYIYDGRNGETVFEGRLDDPSKSAGSDGEVWSLTAVGGSAHTTDVTLPIIYLDRSLDGWEHSITADFDLKNGTAESRTGETAGDILYVQIPAGSPVAQGDRVAFNYMRCRESGQKLALINYQWDAGGTTSNYQVRCISNLGDILVSQNMSTAGGDPGTQVIGTDFTSGSDIFALMIHRSGTGETPGVDTNWVMFWDLRVGATLYNVTGSEITTGYSAADETLTASDIVKDLIGRCMPQVDGPLASIETSTYEFEHLAYPDATTPQQILNDLTQFEPGYYWAVWASTDRFGTKWFLEYRPWPTLPRYEASIDDGFDTPASGADLYNQVDVRWKRPNGRIAITRRTQTVDVLDNATGGALTRRASIDAGDNTVATLATAQQLGDQFLAEHKTGANAGRLRVARPIWDYVLSRWVEPWEIRAGNLIRVRGVSPRADFLNSSAQNGVTIFRVAGTSFSASDNTADLELDAFTFSQQRALAKLDREIAWRRRR